MKIPGYRIFDLLVLFTIVSFLFGGYSAGFRIRVPCFLSGNVEPYWITTPTTVEGNAGEQIWHDPPDHSIWDKILGHPGKDKYAIRQLGASPMGPKRIHWFLVVYDVAVTVLAALFVAVVVRLFRSPKRANSGS